MGKFLLSLLFSGTVLAASDVIEVGEKRVSLSEPFAMSDLNLVQQILLKTPTGKQVLERFDADTKKGLTVVEPLTETVEEILSPHNAIDSGFLYHVGAKPGEVFKTIYVKEGLEFGIAVLTVFQEIFHSTDEIYLKVCAQQPQREIEYKKVRYVLPPDPYDVDLKAARRTLPKRFFATAAIKVGFAKKQIEAQMRSDEALKTLQSELIVAFPQMESYFKN